jgi:hypothetical protein
MTAEDVTEVILAPMQAAYPAPTHLRNDPEARRETLAIYLRTLGRFDRRTLERAWAKVTAEHAYWVWPVPGLIAEACLLFAPRNPPRSEDGERRERAREMSEVYASRYMKTSALARLARREGWAGRLRDYVEAASWVQAQLICRVEDIGWEAALLTRPERLRSSEASFASYRRRIEGAISRGEIQVRVPPGCIREWKAEVHAGKEASPRGG